jgi:type VI secretion system protein ImpK
MPRRCRAFCTILGEEAMNPAPPRTQNLASCYENAFTIIVRLSSLQQAANVQDFRAGIRAALKAAMEQAKALDYASEINQLAFFAVVAFLDESVLRLQAPSLAEWSQRPLQEEMFGHNRAGEVFFEHLRDLLARQDSPETADCLEIYCLCMLLGFRGQYALSSAGAPHVSASGANPGGEIQNLIAHARDKIDRIRGRLAFLPESGPPPAVLMPIAEDRWSRTLGIAALVLFVVVLLAWGGFWFQLHAAASQIGPAAGA